MTQNPLQRKHFLTPKNKWYRNILIDFWKQQIKWDGNDITATHFATKKQNARAIIRAKSSGILAGREEAEFFLSYEKLLFSFSKYDGEKVSTGEEVICMEGSAKTLLKVERTLLNVLSRLSGIATMTKKIIPLLPHSVLLCPTRKTLWGPIDKKGVTVAGGGTHRLGLFDAILVKENHLSLQGELQKVIDILSSQDIVPAHSFWEIEVETAEEWKMLLQNLPEKRPGIIMLDNFSPKQIQQLVQSTPKPEGIFFEASGGITKNTIAEYARTGVDALSAGFLTNAVIPIDYSLRLEEL
jgi:nicotinate-nucleotide pyrophosphorylase (carboxylating)